MISSLVRKIIVLVTKKLYKILTNHYKINIILFFQTGGAQDLRIKMESDFSPPARPTSNTATPQTPTTPIGFGVENSLDGSLPSNLPSPAEIINASWPAAKLANKGGSVNTADG